MGFMATYGRRGAIRDFSGRWLSGSTAPHIVVSAMSVPSDACNFKHQHMSSWSYHSQWCIGGTHERRGVSRQEKGTSKGLDHLPVSVGWSSCWRPGQRLEEAPWPITGPCSPITDRIRGQVSWPGLSNPSLRGSRLAGRGPLFRWRLTMNSTPPTQCLGIRQVICVVTPSTVARSPHARGWSALLAVPNLGRSLSVLPACAGMAPLRAHYPNSEN